MSSIEKLGSSAALVPRDHGLLHAVDALLAGERDWLANLSNVAVLLPAYLRDINWSGFYLWRQGQLVLGPFQGLPACVRIAEGRGVCGEAAARRTTMVVPNVRDFPGHIVCDPLSRSEIVVPILKASMLLGVLDIDSASLGRFGDADRVILESVVECVVHATDWPDFIGKD